MESHAATVLTPYAFCKLQEELVLAAHYASFQVEDFFLVRHHTKIDGGRRVHWIPQKEHLSCSCYQFEFSGILCRHALRVLSTINCFQIPDQYLPIRWRRVNALPAKLIHITPNEHSERVHAFQSMVSTLISESAKSKERLDIATEQISTLLSRIREVPVSAQVMRDVIHRSNWFYFEMEEVNWNLNMWWDPFANLWRMAKLGKRKKKLLITFGYSKMPQYRKAACGGCWIGVMIVGVVNGIGWSCIVWFRGCTL